MLLGQSLTKGVSLALSVTMHVGYVACVCKWHLYIGIMTFWKSLQGCVFQTSVIESSTFMANAGFSLLK